MKSLNELCEKAQELAAEGQLDDAIALFQKAIERDADHVDSHEGLALAFSLTSDWTLAEKHFAKLIQLQPMQARHYINLGTMHNRKGDYQKAVDTLRRALQRDRKNAHTYFNLGLAYRKLKQTAMSVNAYKEAIKLSPEFAEAYLNLANVLTDMGSLQQAVQMLRKAVELKPNSEKARKALEKALAAVNDAKNSASPFGRLVDADARAKSVPTMERDLSDEERDADRKAIRLLMNELEELTKQSLKHLEHVLERKLHDLHVMITSNELGTELTQTSEEFREAVTRWQGLRQQLRRKIIELRAHEELLSAPEIQRR